ncbi:hypothetical protein E2I00_013678, partial [Balaenoptera physalus]
VWDPEDTRLTSPHSSSCSSQIKEFLPSFIVNNSMPLESEIALTGAHKLLQLLETVLSVRFRGGFVKPATLSCGEMLHLGDVPTLSPVAIQTPLGPPPPCTSPGRELQEDGAQFPDYCSKEVYNKENLFNSLNYDVAAKKRKKDMLNSKTKTQYFHQEKWIYVHKGSTKEGRGETGKLLHIMTVFLDRHGYCTLGEAFNRLDFSTAILDSRRFNYVVRRLSLWDENVAKYVAKLGAYYTGDMLNWIVCLRLARAKAEGQDVVSACGNQQPFLPWPRTGPVTAQLVTADRVVLDPQAAPTLLELIAKSQLTSLSGIAQKNFMNILEKVVLKVLEDQQNIRLIRELLQTLYTSLCTLVQRVGKSVLVGNINMWVYRMETILHWQQQLNNIQITRPPFKGLTFTDLPLCLQLNIMQRLSDGRDLVSLGQAAPDLHVLSEDRLLWKKLCQYHFSERQIRKRLILSDKGQLDWKKMYFKLVRCYPRKEQYGDTLQLCRHCHILSWKGTDHPCTANNPESCSVSLSPQDFINLFKF